MTVAYELRRPLQEVLQYSPPELADWLAFFKLRKERIEAEQRKQGDKSKNKARVQRM